MDAQELFKLATDIANAIVPEAPDSDKLTRGHILDVAKLIVQCEQREFQEKGLQIIGEMVETYFADKAEPPPPLPVFHAPGAFPPGSDLTTGLVTERKHPRETKHALLYSDAYGTMWFTLFDEQEDGDAERQRLDGKGSTVLAVYDIGHVPEAEPERP